MYKNYRDLVQSGMYFGGLGGYKKKGGNSSSHSSCSSRYTTIIEICLNQPALSLVEDLAHTYI